MKMTETDNDSSKTQLNIHTFSQVVSDKTVFYQVIKMKESFHLWIGNKPCFGDMSMAMKTKFDTVPLASQLFGDSTNQFSTTLAQRLAKKTGKQVFVSCSVGQDQGAMTAVEKRVVEEMRDHPDMF